MLILLGESGSGKSTIEKHLIENCGFQKVISYTTRPPRENEIDYIDYHFISKDEFNKLKTQNFFIETNEYNNWHYGIAKKDCTETYPYNKVIVLTPSGLRQLKKNAKDIKFVSCYIKVSRSKRLIRILQRGDNVDEAIRRNLADVGQYDGIENEVDFIINNEYNSYHQLIENLKETYLLLNN